MAKQKLPSRTVVKRAEAKEPKGARGERGESKTMKAAEKKYGLK